MDCIKKSKQSKIILLVNKLQSVYFGNAPTGLNTAILRMKIFQGL